MAKIILKKFTPPDIKTFYKAVEIDDGVGTSTD